MDVIASYLFKFTSDLDISGLFFIALKVFIFLIILNMLKAMVDNVAAYFQFKANPYVSIGADVQVDGFEGEITRITFGYIYIVSEDTSRKHKMIRMSTWQNCNWVFINR